MSTATETEDPTSETAPAEPALDAELVAPSGNAPSASLGVERWVFFAFLVGALTVFWVLKNLIVTIWDRFDEPQPVVATAAAAIVAVVGGFALYRKPSIHDYAHSVATEYSLITWPTKDEAWSHTVVVIVVSLVATVILTGLDLAWSSLTDLLYRV